MLPRLLPALTASVASLLSLALLAGCAEDTVAAEEKILIPSTSSPLGPSDGKAGGKAGDQVAGKQKKAKKAKAPQLIVAREAGVRFRPPAGWMVLDKNRLATDASVADRLQMVADQSGLPIETLRSQIEAVDVWLTDYATVLTAGRATQGDSVPSQAEFERMFGTVAADVGPFETIRTPLGDCRVFHYQFTVGGAVWNGSSAYVSHGGRVVEITSGGQDGDRARRVLDTVVASLDDA